MIKYLDKLQDIIFILLLAEVPGAARGKKKKSNF